MSEKILVYRGSHSSEWRDEFEASEVTVDQFGTLRVMNGTTCLAAYPQGHWTRATNGSEKSGQTR